MAASRTDPQPAHFCSFETNQAIYLFLPSYFHVQEDVQRILFTISRSLSDPSTESSLNFMREAIQRLKALSQRAFIQFFIPVL